MGFYLTDSAFASFPKPKAIEIININENIKAKILSFPNMDTSTISNVGTPNELSIGNVTTTRNPIINVNIFFLFLKKSPPYTMII